MTRSRLLVTAAAAAIALGMGAVLLGAVQAYGEDLALMAIALGILAVLSGIVALLAVDIAVTRRVHRNVASVRTQLKRSDDLVRTIHATQERQPTMADITTALDGPLQMALNEGRVELQAISEATVENAIVARRSFEAMARDMREEVAPAHERRTASHDELREAIGQSLPSLRDELHSHIEGVENRLLPRVQTMVEGAVAEKLRSSAKDGGALQRLVRTESMTLFTLLESLDKIHQQLDLDGVLPPFGGWAIRPDLGDMLVELVLEGGREGIVDLGSGISTILLAAATSSVGRGHVVSVDHLPAYAEVTREHLARLGLTEWATVHVAPLVPTEVGDETYSWYDHTVVDWPDQIDLLLVDGPPGTTGAYARYPAVPVLRGRLAKDAVVLLDDARRPGEQAIGARWSEQLEGSSSDLLEHAVGTFRLDVGGRGRA